MPITCFGCYKQAPTDVHQYLCTNAECTLVDDTGIPEGRARAVLTHYFLPHPPESIVLLSLHGASPPRAKRRLLVVVPIIPKAKGSGTWSL